MLKVAAFLVPAEQDKANEFIAGHKILPNGINFNTDRLVIFYDDDPAAMEVELLASAKAARTQQEIALAVTRAELEGLPTNLSQYDKLSSQIRELEQSTKLQLAKEDFLTKRIDEVRGTTSNGAG